MKRTFLLSIASAAALVLAAAPAVHAQAAPAASPAASPAAKKAAKPKMDIDDRIARMKSDLGLSDDQTTKLKEIFTAQKAKLDPIFANDSLTPAQKREQAKPITADTRKQIADVLTPEQKAKMKSLRKSKGDKKDS